MSGFCSKRPEHRFSCVLRTSLLCLDDPHLGCLTSSVRYVRQQQQKKPRLDANNRRAHLQLLEVLQAAEGSPGDRSDLRLLHFPGERKNKTKRSNCAASKLSDTLAAGMCSLMGKPQKSSPVLRCSVDARVSQVGTGYPLPGAGIFFFMHEANCLLYRMSTQDSQASLASGRWR